MNVVTLCSRISNACWVASRYSRLLVRHCKTMCAANLLSCIVIGVYLFVGNGHVILHVDDFIRVYIVHVKK